MSDKSWKAFERRVAAYFATQRNALSGGNSKLTRSDSLHPVLFIECKQRQRHSAVALWDATRELADREAKIPVVALSEKHRPGFWLVLHSDDLARLAALVSSQPDSANRHEPEPADTPSAP